MPIYEYEPQDHDCMICKGRMEVLQKASEDALSTCPTCGLGVRRVISRPSIRVETKVSADQAAAKGFSTFRKLESGKYEKVAGDGPSTLDADNL